MRRGSRRADLIVRVRLAGSGREAAGFGGLLPAVERLAAAWELHAETLAASPVRG